MKVHSLSLTAVTEPITEAQLEPLIHLLLSSDLEVQKAASLALSNLALHGPRKNSSEWFSVSFRVCECVRVSVCEYQ